MKRWMKICLTAGLICVLTGSGITAAAAVMGGAQAVSDYHKSYFWSDFFRGMGNRWAYWDDWDDWDEGYHEEWDDWAERHHVEPAAVPGFEGTKAAPGDAAQIDGGYTFTDIKKLDVEASIGMFKVVEGEEGSTDIRVVFQDESYYNCYREENELKIKIRQRKGSYYGDEFAEDRNVTVTVPKGYRLKEADFELGAGELFVEALNADELDVEVMAGEARLQNITADILSAEVKAGSLVCDGDVAKEIKGECKAGELKLLLSGAQTDYNYNLEYKAGEITLGSENLSGVKGEKFIDNQASKNVDLECSTGSITVKFES